MKILCKDDSANIIVKDLVWVFEELKDEHGSAINVSLLNTSSASISGVITKGKHPAVLSITYQPGNKYKLWAICWRWYRLNRPRVLNKNQTSKLVLNFLARISEMKNKWTKVRRWCTLKNNFLESAFKQTQQLYMSIKSNNCRHERMNSKATWNLA